MTHRYPSQSALWLALQEPVSGDDTGLGVLAMSGGVVDDADEHAIPLVRRRSSTPPAAPVLEVEEPFDDDTLWFDSAPAYTEARSLRTSFNAGAGSVRTSFPAASAELADDDIDPGLYRVVPRARIRTARTLFAVLALVVMALLLLEIRVLVARMDAAEPNATWYSGR